ncbi:hypothetical protein DL96DRAFT_1666611 [Flagelloscypha sp. PMI_526]|nr:hypothetical protein DL96DRAFT_1666611 [Flagelloscypha sp. PMI_526]
MGPGDKIGAGDSRLVTDLLPPNVEEEIFEKLVKEVEWNTMFHRGGEVPRQVAVQGEVGEDGSFPIYRHPADESPPLRAFSPTVELIREHVQKVLQHPVNHVLIQHYRTGNDYISEHSDKTIDIVRGTNIVNVSLGAQRTMTLYKKKDLIKKAAADSSQQELRQPADESAAANTEEGQTPSASSAPKAPGPPRPSQRIPLPHNSMFVMGLHTNSTWVHAINRDNRPATVKSPPERLYNGARISLTFRHIGTFLSSDETKIWGQGAVGKTKDEAREVVNGGDSAQELLDQFGFENQKSDFDWDTGYGKGFDVLHFNPL